MTLRCINYLQVFVGRSDTGLEENQRKTMYPQPKDGRLHSVTQKEEIKGQYHRPEAPDI